MFRALLLVLAFVTASHAGLSTLSRYKTYAAGQVYTAADVNAQQDHFVNAYNEVVAYLPGGTTGDSIKVTTATHDTLTASSIGKLVLKDPLTSLSANDSLLYHLIHAYRANLDSIYVGGVPVAGFPLAAAAGKRSHFSYADIDTAIVDTLRSTALSAQRARVDTLYCLGGQLTIESGPIEIRSDSVGHSYVSQADSNVYFLVTKGDAGAGGASIFGFRDADGFAAGALTLVGVLNEDPNTTKGAAGRGIVNIVGRQVAADTASNMAANALIASITTKVAGSTSMRWAIDAEGTSWQAGQILTGGEASNANADTGSVTIQQRSGFGEAITLKSSNVDHGYTGSETDTYGTIARNSDNAGGLRIRGYRDADYTERGALSLTGFLAERADSTATSASGGIVQLIALLTDTTALADSGDDTNIISVHTNRSGSLATLWLIKGDGDTWQPGSITAEGNGEIQGMFSIGDSPSWGYALEVSNGAIVSRMDAGDTQFANTSMTSKKNLEESLDSAVARKLLDVLSDSVTVRRWRYKEGALRSRQLVDHMWADTLRLDDVVEEKVAELEQQVVDSTATTRKVYDEETGEEIGTETVWTPVRRKVNKAQRDNLLENTRIAQIAQVQDRVAAYEQEVSRRAQKQYVGLVAEEAYRISQLVAPDDADPTVMNGNHIQAGLILAVQELYRQNKALQDRMDEMRADYERRLRDLEKGRQ